MSWTCRGARRRRGRASGFVSEGEKKQQNLGNTHRCGNETLPHHLALAPELASQPISSVSPIQKKPVTAPLSNPSPRLSGKTELSGQEVTGELPERDAHPLPNMTSSPPMAVPEQHEMWADSHPLDTATPGQAPGRHEMPAQNRRQEMAAPGSQNP